MTFGASPTRERAQADRLGFDSQQDRQRLRRLYVASVAGVVFAGWLIGYAVSLPIGPVGGPLSNPSRRAPADVVAPGPFTVGLFGDPAVSNTEPPPVTSPEAAPAASVVAVGSALADPVEIAGPVTTSAQGAGVGPGVGVVSADPVSPVPLRPVLLPVGELLSPVLGPVTGVLGQVTSLLLPL